jgi:hypothetical protein
LILTRALLHKNNKLGEFLRCKKFLFVEQSIMRKECQSYQREFVLLVDSFQHLFQLHTTEQD